jgi:hypothetical protein
MNPDAFHGGLEDVIELRRVTIGSSYVRGLRRVMREESTERIEKEDSLIPPEQELAICEKVDRPHRFIHI